MTNCTTLKTRFGNTPKDQHIVMIDGCAAFKSYNSVIALVDHEGITHLSDHWDYSATTGYYRNQFLGEGIADTRIKIKSGIYKMDLSTNGRFKA